MDLSPDPILTVSEIYSGYDGVPVVFGISFEIMPGEFIAIVGANGAGKTTTMRTVSGLIHPFRGKILFLGHDISSMPAHEILKLDISYIPEGRQILGKLSVKKNSYLGAYTEGFRSEIDEPM